jgi:hypothetical protein
MLSRRGERERAAVEWTGSTWGAVQNRTPR